MTDAPDMEPAALEAAITDEQIGEWCAEAQSKCFGVIPQAKYVIARALAARSAPEAGKAVDWKLELARKIVAGRAFNRPSDTPGERLVGFYVQEDVAGLSDALFALDAIRDHLASSPAPTGAEPVAPTGEIAGLVNAIISRLIYPVSTEINPRGWEFRETSMLEEAVRFIKNEAAAALTASEAEAADLRRKLGELLAVIHRDGGHYQDFAGTEQATADAQSAVVLLFQAQDERNDLRRKLEEHQDAEDKAAREMATVIQGLRNRATAAERKLEEARKALERAAVAAYDEPHYLGPEGMERGADGLLPPGSPYDRGRYDARKAVEVVTRQALESDNG